MIFRLPQSITCPASDEDEDWDIFYVNMLKGDNHDSVDTEQDEVTLAEGKNKDANENSEIDEEHTTERIPSNKRDEEDEDLDGIKVEDESKNEAEDENENELEAKDYDNNKEVMEDNKILNEEGYAEL
ncbi:hypothetical protein BGY98DRAFT_937692 [Russula aff. rugulosa BPL654]|nr:hypothetical protein BGY98DRAFT_937692 [Russula aff. rugulosa BPL654]